MEDFNADVCVICRTEIDKSHTVEPWITLTSKGVDTLRQYSIMRGDTLLQQYLLTKDCPINAHVSCRKRYTNKRHLEQETSQNAAEDTRSKCLRSVNIFNWKQDCFLCGALSRDMHNSGRKDTSAVETLELKSTVLQVCEERNDSWATEVKGRLNTCSDLVAEEAIYHRDCLASFCMLRVRQSEANLASVGSSCASGRNEDAELRDAFNNMCLFLDSTGDELYTLCDLTDMMKNMSESKEKTYSERHMKRKLEEFYGDHIFFASVSGRKNVICFRNMASCIINEAW